LNSDRVFEVALAAPVMQLFDYLPPTAESPAGIRGQRIIVPFGKNTRVGMLVRIKGESSIARNRLRRATRIIDVEPLLDEEIMTLLEWAAHYYQYPPGEVFGAALPGILRRGGAARTTETCWTITVDGRKVEPDDIRKKAPVQSRILERAANSPSGLMKDQLAGCGASWRQSVSVMESRGWLERSEQEAAASAPVDVCDQPPTLTDAQVNAVDAINQKTGFAAFLLEGVTGSGKTEVYLRAIEEQLTKRRQTLVLVPEIGLTPQLVERFQRRLDTKIVAVHSGLSDGERMRAWCAARDGSAGVVIGTRSAVFTPLPRPGLIVIDEEHDSSLKQQDGFRYSARDLAVWRARHLDIPVVLGSATPSFESLENINAGRYQRLELPRRPGNATHPEIRLIDLRKQPIKDGLTEPLRNAISRHLDADGQVLLYLNRRGYAPSLLCTSCGYVAQCRRCDSRMVLHQHKRKLICHHCGAERTATQDCPECSGTLFAVGQGTERLEAALREQFPDQGIVRIDRDTTRRRGEIQRRLESVRSGASRLVLGTQMLTKGHDFPNVTLVGIIDADQGLFGTDFRSSERLAQSFIQVAGRAGRANRAGEVYIQTLFPDHPLLTLLVNQGYRPFAGQAMVQRRLAGWPPFTYLALLRAESVQRPPVFDFLNAARDVACETAPADIGILGPAPAPMERRSGRFRGQLLIRANSRSNMQHFLNDWRSRLDDLKSARRTRWSLDIDPVELF
jgi:primosomal protein N' (replication factor Y)